MKDDPHLNAIIDNAVRAQLTASIGWEESVAEPYIVPVREKVLEAIAAAGYVVEKSPPFHPHVAA